MQKKRMQVRMRFQKSFDVADSPQGRGGVHAAVVLRPSRAEQAALQAGRALAGDAVAVVDGERVLVALDRLLPVALALVGDAAPGPGTGILGIDVEGRVEVLDRLVELV